MSNRPLVRKAIAGAALQAGVGGNPLVAGAGNPLVVDETRQESAWTPAALERAGSTLKALNRMAKRPPVNLTFEDVTYTVRSSAGERKILNGISGELRSGELTAILGPSGAGKSSLLNILVGYASAGVEGRISVNGHARDMKIFHKLSSYIMQDDLLQPRLTVLESMRVAADLKLGAELGRAEKELIVQEILETLGLWTHRDTMSERLSGGQAKRLSVALELVNNPPIIFLDEPTTGLDVVSIRQLVVLLRLLSRQGRTIVCTIHQPSASLFSLFDRVYIMADGLCCYQGAAPLLVPYMSEIGYVCPTTHNPADFVLETLCQYQDAAAAMAPLCQNGKLCRKIERMVLRGGKKPVLHSDESILTMFTAHVAKESQQKMEFPTSFLTQFLILTRRMFLQTVRNTTSLWIQLAHHVISAVLLGSIFLGIGNDGSKPIVNFKFCISVIVFFMYTYVMIPVLLFPTEVRMLRREYFNRWYGLKAYYAALTVKTVPTIAILGVLFMGICYLMSGQPMEWERFVLFSAVGLMTGLCSEGLGLAVGSAFSVMNGSIVGPATAAPLLALSVYGMGFGTTIEKSMHLLMAGSYLRYGVTGLAIALYDNRPPMECDDVLCVYDRPEVLMRDLGMQGSSYWLQILGLTMLTVLHRVAAYLALRYRLTAEFSNRFLQYVDKVLKHKR